jgi:hypothetical protein
MKYIIACLISLGMVRAVMAQDYYDKNNGDYPSVDSRKNDHFDPSLVNDKRKNVFVRQDLSARPAANINDHLPMEQALNQTEFGKACSMKKMGSGEQSDLSSAKVFKMKDKNLKVERKANGEERIKFHNKNEFLIYHLKKNGQSHYKYLYKEGSSLVRVEKRKNGVGMVILASGNFENDLPFLLREEAVSGLQREVNTCMR